MATTCGRLRRFCLRWPPCARKKQRWPANSLRSSSRNFRKTPSLLVSWPSSIFHLPRPKLDNPSEDNHRCRLTPPHEVGCVSPPTSRSVLRRINPSCQEFSCYVERRLINYRLLPSGN